MYFSADFKKIAPFTRMEKWIVVSSFSKDCNWTNHWITKCVTIYDSCKLKQSFFIVNIQLKLILDEGDFQQFPLFYVEQKQVLRM